MSPLEVGRDAFERRAWGEAYTQLSAADVGADLSLDDLERLATAAYLTGQDDCVDAWARAYQQCLTLGEAARAARCAGWAAHGSFEAGEVARGGGWLTRARVVLTGISLHWPGWGRVRR